MTYRHTSEVNGTRAVPQVKRTLKLCSVISTCPRLVTDEWLKACESANAFVQCTQALRAVVVTLLLL